MASVETVLKHLYTFVTTLSKAHTEQVNQWDLKSLQNAFNWAKYAEEVYMKLKDRSFKMDLDSRIRDMTVHVTPVSCIQMNFDKLEKSSEILFFTLIQNPYFPEIISQDLFLLYNAQQDKFNFKLNSKSCILTTDNTTLAVGKDIMKTLHGPEDQDLELNIVSQAKCLLNGLSNVISRQKDTHRSTSYMQTFLKRLCEVKHGISVTISMYLQAGGTDDQVKQDISKALFDFLRKNIVSFQNVPDMFLIPAVNIDFHFAELFTDWLIGKARTFSLNYPDGELYTWTCAEIDGDKSFSFQTLCKYFEIPLKSNKQTKRDVISLLKRYSEESLVNIFKDILRHFSI